MAQQLSDRISTIEVSDEITVLYFLDRTRFGLITRTYVRLVLRVGIKMMVNSREWARLEN